MLEGLDQNTINLVVLVMTSITFLMACVSVLPQIRAVVAILREVVLWGGLIVIVVVVAGVGWLRFAEALQRRSAESASDGAYAFADSSDSIAANRSHSASTYAD